MNGFLIFNSRWDGRTYRIQVRACPDPSAARAAVEELTGSPVRWEAAR